MSLFDDPRMIACPMCGTTEPLDIVYGLPSNEMMDAASEGAIVLGGCIIGDDPPAYRCRNEDCGNEFGRL